MLVRQAWVLRVAQKAGGMRWVVAARTQLLIGVISVSGGPLQRSARSRSSRRSSPSQSYAIWDRITAVILSELPGLRVSRGRKTHEGGDKNSADSRRSDGPVYGLSSARVLAAGGWAAGPPLLTRSNMLMRSSARYL